jgi:hypothetical protein
MCLYYFKWEREIKDLKNNPELFFQFKKKEFIGVEKIKLSK